MKMISFWQDIEVVYKDDDGFTIIIGLYNHQNLDEKGYKALGIHWETYPTSRGVLSPSTISPPVRDAILSGLLHQAVANKNMEQVKSITKAIEFFA